jgi:hypothetical protein
MAEFIPKFRFSSGAGMAAPSPKHVVYKPFIKSNVLLPLREKLLLVQAKENGGPWWCWGNAHPSARFLAPVGITKLQKVVLENDVEDAN